MKKKLFFIFIFLSVAGISGCGVSYKLQTTPPLAQQLVVPRYFDGEDIFLTIKNTEGGTTKRVRLYGVLLGEFRGGEGLDGRFTRLIYKLAERKYEKRWYDRWSNDRTTIELIKIHLEVDLIEGKSRFPSHYITREQWITTWPEGRSTAKFEI